MSARPDVCFMTVLLPVDQRDWINALPAAAQDQFIQNALAVAIREYRPPEPRRSRRPDAAVAKTIAALAAEGLTLEQARELPDRQLRRIYGIGPRALGIIRGDTS